MTLFLSRHHQDCEIAFQNLWNASQHQSASTFDPKAVSRLQDLNDRYTVWAANLGVGHTGASFKKSLDYRLRDAPVYKDVVSDT